MRHDTAIEEIEQRRIRGGFSHEQLAERADLANRTWRRIRASRLAFPRHVRALRQALRSLEREARQMAEQYGED